MNLLRESLRLPNTPEPCTFVIFGASGDLTRRKLMPALYALAAEQQLPGGFSVVGAARREWNDAQFRERMRAAVAEFSRIPFQSAVWEPFAASLFYLPVEYDDPLNYGRLKEVVKDLATQKGTRGNSLFYLATPPSAFPPIIRRLGESGLACPAAVLPEVAASGQGVGQPWARIIVEKPFGRDLASAHELDRLLQQVFGEEQVYRIDHYLGKETVQNILVFRFANGIFEPVWNRRYVDHVQITVAESIGVEERGAFYEESGALRDMVQNHLMQLLALVAMEPPAAFGAREVRQEKEKLLRAVRPMSRGQAAGMAVRGQYGPGAIAGATVPSYRQETSVAADSRTETFAALRLHIDNWRWAGVPFLLRSGKRLPRRVTEIAVRFRRPPLGLFPETPLDQLESNLFAFRIQPDEGISLRFEAKVPGQELHVRPVNMEFRYGTSFGAAAPEAYETLLLDAMRGDATHFAWSETVETCWALLEPLLEAWAAEAPADFPNYEAGTWGPAAADRLFEDAGCEAAGWRRP
jgi:glucose-6-phosphate 1-dehydrogenase